MYGADSRHAQALSALAQLRAEAEARAATLSATLETAEQAACQREAVLRASFQADKMSWERERAALLQR